MLHKPLTTLAAGAVLAAAIFGAGWWLGAGHVEAEYEAERAKAQKDVFRLGEALSRKATEIEALQGELDATAEEHDNAARAAGGGRSGVGADGLRRLDGRWSGSQ